MRALAFVSSIACLTLLYRSQHKLGVPLGSLHGIWGPAFYASASIVTCWSLAGLETTWYAYLAFLTVVVASSDTISSRRAIVLGILCGVCALTRPDGILIGLSVLLFLVAGRRIERKRLLLFLTPAVLLVGSHLMWWVSYYGEWLPSTAYAKVGFQWAQALRGGDYLLKGTQDLGSTPLWLIVFLAPWVRRRSPFLKHCSATGVILALGVVAVGGDGLPMYRFLVPIIPFWVVLMGDLLARIRAEATIAQVRFWVSAGVGSAAVCLLLLPPKHLQQYDLFLFQRDFQVPIWTGAGKWLATHSSPDSSLACVPIGTFGYFSSLRVYDMLGLTDKHIAKMEATVGSGWARHEKHDGPYILSQKPTYLLLGNIQVIKKALPLDHPQFCRPPAPVIRAWEKDVFQPEFYENYSPRVVPLREGYYFHFYQRDSPRLFLNKGGQK
jgi:arabinofuranosyltransferase